jgi:hypothetical protein
MLILSPTQITTMSANDLKPGDIVSPSAGSTVSDLFLAIGEEDGKGAIAVSLLPLRGEHAFKYSAGRLAANDKHRYVRLNGLSPKFAVPGLPKPLSTERCRGLLLVGKNGLEVVVERVPVDGAFSGFTDLWKVDIDSCLLDQNSCDFSLAGHAGYASWKLSIAAGSSDSSTVDLLSFSS